MLQINVQHALQLVVAKIVLVLQFVLDVRLVYMLMFLINVQCVLMC
jgi:hypothetical protein